MSIGLGESTDRVGKVKNHTPTMHAHKGSDAPVVPTKRPNEAVSTAEEDVEGSGAPDGNSNQQAESSPQRQDVLVPGLARVREAAGRSPYVRMTSLLHHVTEVLLEEAYNDLNRHALPGVDRVTWDEYGGDGFRDKIQGLHERIHSGRYRALPSMRLYIPKANGKLRPIGISAIEDKIVQRAMTWVLEAVYEEDFCNFSYGSRPGRGAHSALDAVAVAIQERNVSWVLDADIAGFFDNIDHEWLKKFLAHRINDLRVQRLISNWLRAGVSDNGEWSKTKIGTPQGAVISPLLANIFLHYVFDLWIKWWRNQEGVGEVYVVRYMDDFLIMFQVEADARRCLEELKTRFLKFGLELHPEKTRLIEFGRKANDSRKDKGLGKPETFNFLGFRHMCSKTFRTKQFSVMRITICERMRRKIHDIAVNLREHITEGTETMGIWLRQVVLGYYRYFAVPGNVKTMFKFRYEVIGIWWKVLRRRSEKASRNLTWAKMKTIADRWIPVTKALHPYPSQRLRVGPNGRAVCG